MWLRSPHGLTLLSICGLFFLLRYRVLGVVLHRRVSCYIRAAHFLAVSNPEYRIWYSVCLTMDMSTLN